MQTIRVVLIVFSSLSFTVAQYPFNRDFSETYSEPFHTYQYDGSDSYQDYEDIHHGRDNDDKLRFQQNEEDARYGEFEYRRFDNQHDNQMEYHNNQDFNSYNEENGYRFDKGRDSVSRYQINQENHEYNNLRDFEYSHLDEQYVDNSEHQSYQHYGYGEMNNYLDYDDRRYGKQHVNNLDFQRYKKPQRYVDNKVDRDFQGKRYDDNLRYKELQKRKENQLYNTLYSGNKEPYSKYYSNTDMDQHRYRDRNIYGENNNVNSHRRNVDYEKPSIKQHTTNSGNNVYDYDDLIDELLENNNDFDIYQYELGENKPPQKESNIYYSNVNTSPRNRNIYKPQNMVSHNNFGTIGRQAVTSRTPIFKTQNIEQSTGKATATDMVPQKNVDNANSNESEYKKIDQFSLNIQGAPVKINTDYAIETNSPTNNLQTNIDSLQYKKLPSKQMSSLNQFSPNNQLLQYQSALLRSKLSQPPSITKHVLYNKKKLQYPTNDHLTYDAKFVPRPSQLQKFFLSDSIRIPQQSSVISPAQRLNNHRFSTDVLRSDKRKRFANSLYSSGSDYGEGFGVI